MITGQYIRITIKYSEGAEDYIECDLNDYETAAEFKKCYKRFVRAMGKNHLFTSDLISVSKYFKNQTKYVSVFGVCSIGTELIQSMSDEEDSVIELTDPFETLHDGINAMYTALNEINNTLKEILNKDKKPAAKKKVLVESKKEVKKSGNKTNNKI